MNQRQNERVSGSPPSRSGAPRPPHPQARLLSEYLWGLIAVGVFAGFSTLVFRYLQLSDLVMLNLLPVIAVSMRCRLQSSLFTAVLSALCFAFLFIPPKLSLAASDLKSLVTLLVMVVVATVIRGLAERARRQQRAVQAHDLQIETERLRSVLLSAVSHDLRTPLATIFGAGTELLEDGSALDESERDELVQAIVDEAAHLDQLVSNLLQVARLDGGPIVIRKHPEPLDEVVEAALGRVRGRLANRSIRSRVPEGVPMVPIDAVLIQQVLVNLLENALRYTAEGSPLEIEAACAGGHVTLEVRDCGPGIREEEADRLFERFYRGQSQTSRDGGVGLGLTICQAIMTAHGGSIALENREQGGAVARLTLPLDKGVDR